MASAWYSLMIEEYSHISQSIFMSFHRTVWVRIRLAVSVPLSKQIDFWELHVTALTLEDLLFTI